jgi:hypothetical protein
MQKSAIRNNTIDRINQNKQSGDEIKQQKVRIAASIEASKRQALEEKRARYF